MAFFFQNILFSNMIFMLVCVAAMISWVVFLFDLSVASSPPRYHDSHIQCHTCIIPLTSYQTYIMTDLNIDCHRWLSYLTMASQFHLCVSQLVCLLVCCSVSWQSTRLYTNKPEDPTKGHPLRWIHSLTTFSVEETPFPVYMYAACSSVHTHKHIYIYRPARPKVHTLFTPISHLLP